ncbi:MAG: hypothetical protein E7214_01130 [Clostridium sp.]|nr:hypothetical protein [Clostridium sp.]
MKKIISILLSVLLIFFVIPAGDKCQATILSGDAILEVEQPALGKSYKETLPISGYALNHSRVKEVNTYIDGSQKQSCTTGINREDKYELLKKYLLIYPNVTNCGFEGSYNLQNVDLGLHTLKVEAVGRDNTKAEKSLYIYVYVNVNNERVAEVITDKADASVPFYRYWKKGSDEHFYSISLKEADEKTNYQAENLTCSGYASKVEGTIPVYRFFRFSDKSYIYTSNEEEANGYRLDASNFRNDGVQVYIYESKHEGSIPLYRYVKNDSDTHEKAIYFYTFNWNELGPGREGKYQFKEIVGYVNKVDNTEVPDDDSDNVAPFYQYKIGASLYLYAAVGLNLNVLGIDLLDLDLNLGVKLCYVHGTQVEGTVPLYRYSKKYTKEYAYTTDYNLYKDGAGTDYVYDGVACYVYSEQAYGTKPLYKYVRNDGVTLFTTDYNELKEGNSVYKYDGIECYIL